MGTELQLRLDWSEMDLFGHINNVMYFKYIQAARVNYWETIGAWSISEAVKTGPILASCQCDFKKALHYPGVISIQTHVTEMGNTSYIINHKIYNDKKELCAEARDVIVMYDFGKNEKTKIPEIIRQAVHKIEQRTF